LAQKTKKKTTLSTNFEKAEQGKSFTFGQKSLKYIKNEDSSCVFEFIDKKNNLTQKFKLSPRFYLSDESQGDGGDGLYEFRPLNQTSKVYSKIESIKFKEGKHSS